MEETKIQLSPDELLLMQNSDWILTKNSVIDKISQGFGSLVSRMQQEVTRQQPMIDEKVLFCSPKISRGEKYQGLPYVMLDYPRIFNKEHIIAIRTLFWWGNYCSITLHLKGEPGEIISRRLITAFGQFSKSNFYISFSGNEWGHDLANEDYKALRSHTREELEIHLPGTSFLKLTAKVEIDQWLHMEKRLFDLFLDLLDLIKA